MFQIIAGSAMELTRGDTGRFTVSVQNQDGSPYSPASGDVMVFSVKKSVTDTEYLIHKTITGGQVIIEPEDTQSLPFGNYVYDIQLTLENGDVNTIVPPSTFTVCGEVSYGEA
ncbi:hypothetical protein [Youxingia wuxianensis]|uniref:Uncharacterized protein n=1 Tax=Youxingia wuxianensis TaxID=2763678 RepID=A0A926IH53_9FIRM|nr:hypothetical protein [Youxingia wuxianensis]MBC8585554.1 hypothetical protein [Youxingia wuxianensis]